MEKNFWMALEETQVLQTPESQDKQPNEQTITNESTERTKLMKFIVF